MQNQECHLFPCQIVYAAVNIIPQAGSLMYMQHNIVLLITAKISLANYLLTLLDKKNIEYYVPYITGETSCDKILKIGQRSGQYEQK